MSKFRKLIDKLEKEIEEDRPISKQLKWQRKQKALGNCITCGKKAIAGLSLCIDHTIYRREYARKRFGCKPKQPGGTGRNLKYV